jgi:hypothetical protein
MATLGTLTVKIGADLTELNRGLGQAGASVADLGKEVSGVGKSLTGNLTAPIRESSAALVEHSRHIGGSIEGLSEMRRELLSVVREVTGANPALLKMGSLLGKLEVGAPEMIAVLAGLAALSLAWEKLTEGARENAKATAEAIKVLEEYRRKKLLGVGGELGASVNTAKDQMPQEILKLDALTKERKMFDKNDTSIRALQLDQQIKAQQDHIAHMRAIIRDGEDGVTKLKKDDDDKRAADQQSALDREIAAWKEAIDKKIALMHLEGDVLQAMLQREDDIRTRSAELNKLGLGVSAPSSGAATIRSQMRTRLSQGLEGYGFGKLPAGTIDGAFPALKPTEITATYNSIPAQLSKNELALRDGFKEVADSIGNTLAGKLLMAFGAGSGAGSSFGSSVGGQIGGKLGAGAVGSLTGKLGQAAFPIIGGLVGSLAGGLFGSLFDHKKSVDSNTEALNKLTESITNGPTGFKANSYRYAATNGDGGMPAINIGTVITLSGADFMRYIRQAGNDFGARGGYALASG